MTDGENSLPPKSMNDRLKEFEAILDEYETKIGLGGIRFNHEVEECLTLTRSQINAMTIQECSVFGLMIAQYSAFLQMQYNRQKTRMDWATRELDLIIAKDASKYGYGDDKNFVKYDVVKSKVIVANEAARILSNIIKHAAARAQELEQMSTKISMIGKSIFDIKMMKVKNE